MEPQASAKAYFSLKVTLWSGCQSSQSGGLRCDSGLQICFCFRCQGERKHWTNNAWRQSHTCHPSASDISIKGEENRHLISDMVSPEVKPAWWFSAPVGVCSSSSSLTPLFQVAVNVLRLLSECWAYVSKQTPYLKLPDSANNCTKFLCAFVWRGVFRRPACF